MKVYEEGLWNEIGEVSFLSGNKEKCFITESGDTTIRVTSIDDKLQEKPVSIIKMDIEGSEMKALEGAKNTIKKFKPRLAICVYHRPEDIVDIPQELLDLVADAMLSGTEVETLKPMLNDRVLSDEEILSIAENNID